MRVPLSWLREYVPLDDIPIEALAERLTTAGLEVATIEYIGVPGPAHADHLVWDRETIRVGQIEAVEPHPNADRLRLVTVAYGEATPRTVVTGAPNVRAGQRVAYATVGATVLNGHSAERERVTLAPKKLRGILSEGMVLSERELGLGDGHEGILELPDDAPIGEPLQAYLGDMVLHIDLTPNLGRAASVVGVAREVAALWDRPLRLPPLNVPATGAPASEAVRIEIAEPRFNPRFTASLVRGVRVAPSPAWMQRRLERAGMRPINNVVDITNYVMLELGQPLHAFDYDKLVARARNSGAEVPTLRTRLARAGETLRTLDDAERTLRPEDVLVTDTAGILALAGIMGGLETEVTSETTTVLLEAAAWDFIATRRAATRLGIFSEAAYRFSRGVHPAMALRGNLRATALLAELCGGAAAQGVVDEYPNPAPPVELTLPVATVNRQLGTDLSVDEVAAYLARLEFAVEQEGETLRVTVPDHRLDITLPADLVEEVARVHGLDRLPSTLLQDALPPLRLDRTMVIEERIRDLLVGAGLTETISYALTTPEREAALLPQPHADADASDAGYVRLANPITQERRVMRRTLLASAVETLQTNLKHRARAAVFEIGLAYLPDSGDALPTERRRLALAMTGPRHEAGWLAPAGESADFFDLKGVVDTLLAHLHLTDRARFQGSDHPTLQPGRAATLLLDGEPVGVLGEMHPLARRANALPDQRIALAELDLEALIAAAPSGFDLVAVPRFPPVVQDIAVVVDEALPASEVERVIRAAGGERLAGVALFDVYRGASIPAGRKSLAYTLRFLHPEKTMTDDDIAPDHARVAAALREQLGASIRGE